MKRARILLTILVLAVGVASASALGNIDPVHKGNEVTTLLDRFPASDTGTRDALAKEFGKTVGSKLPPRRA